MRALEAVFLGILLLALALPVLFRRRRLGWITLLAVPALALHLLVEGSRWQMVPAYLLAALLLVRWVWRWLRPGDGAEQRSFVANAGTIGGLFLWMLAAALSIVFPVPSLAAPGGQYVVGTTTAQLRDDAREEVYTPAPEDKREIVVQVWYPAAERGDSERAPYLAALEVAGPAVARRLELPSFLLGHLDHIETHAYVDAPAADGVFPLLIFSHGLRGLRTQNARLMEELASQGYIVASVDHTYGSVLTVFPDGRVVFYNDERVFPDDVPFIEAGARLVDVWAADALFVAEQMAAWNEEEDHLLAGRIDTGRLGTLGHSTGGATAVEACAQMAACQAALGLDAWVQPVSDTFLEDYPKALMLLSAPEWLGPENDALGAKLFRERAGEGHLLTMAGAEHFDFTDLPLLSPLTPALGLSGEIDGRRALAIINAYSVAFFDRNLKGETSPLLEGPSPDYPEVSFSE